MEDVFDDVNTKLIIVDTDVGVDDACALMLLLGYRRHPLRPVHVLAITTVNGNVGVDQACRNAHRVLRAANRLDIPVYRGMETSYARVCVQDPVKPFSAYHGNDGLGDFLDPDDSSDVTIQEEHAALAIIRLINQYPGRVTLLCLGPLTNIALALRLEPNLGEHLRDCYIMGGNYKGKGNSTPSAEFNFFTDPEGADVVLKQLRCPITLVTWELCIDHPHSQKWIADFTSVDTTAHGRFVAAIVQSMVKKHYSGDSTTDNQYITCDEIAAAIVVDERIVTQMTSVALDGVDQTGRATRGQLVIDWRKKLSDTDTIPLKLVTGIDMDLFQRMLIEALENNTD